MRRKFNLDHQLIDYCPLKKFIFCPKSHSHDDDEWGSHNKMRATDVVTTKEKKAWRKWKKIFLCQIISLQYFSFVICSKSVFTKGRISNFFQAKKIESWPTFDDYSNQKRIHFKIDKCISGLTRKRIKIFDLTSWC